MSKITSTKPVAKSNVPAANKSPVKATKAVAKPAANVFADYAIADLSLAAWGRKELNIA